MALCHTEAAHYADGASGGFLLWLKGFLQGKQFQSHVGLLAISPNRVQHRQNSRGGVIGGDKREGGIEDEAVLYLTEALGWEGPSLE